MSVKPKVLWYLSRQLLMLNRFFFISSVPERRGFSMEKVKKKNGLPPCFCRKILQESKLTVTLLDEYIFKPYQTLLYFV